jgi:hypothetical protein
MYTRENDTTRLEHGRGSDLAPYVPEGMLTKLSSDPSSSDFINPPVAFMPICLDQALRSQLLKEMPTLYDIDIAVLQRSDVSCGVRILGTDATDGRRTTTAILGSSKGNGKVVSSRSATKAGSRSPSGDDEASSEDDVPQQRRKRQLRSDGSAVGGPPLLRQQVLENITVP